MQKNQPRNTRKPDRPVDWRPATDTHQVVSAAWKLSNGKISRRHSVIFSCGSCISWFKRIVPAQLVFASGFVFLPRPSEGRGIEGEGFGYPPSALAYSLPQRSPPRFLELAARRRLCPRLHSACVLLRRDRPAGNRFAYQHRQKINIEPGMTGYNFEA